MKTSAARVAQTPVDFKQDIQPILSSRCYQCHAGANAQADLRLDTRAGALRGGVSGPSITPGKGRESLLVRRLLGHGDEPRMPMGGEPLKAEQIAVLQRWIDQGAVWPESAAVEGERATQHWAFVRPARPRVPAVKNAAWARNPIDNFVLAQLEKDHLTPSPEASKETLVRRVSLDLTGLPPSIAEVDQFADRSPQADENLIDRLLGSPHYGERWGRHWLDAARYADTNGFEKDDTRSIWPYRDWVINAVNRDLPFDQFTVEQLAGDLLPKPTLEQRVATGFLRNSMLNEEGAVDPEQFRVEGLIDRVDAVGKAFLGLTVNCAQCHTHKFDPIPHKDYYRFYAFLNSDEEPEVEVPGDEVTKRRAEIASQVAKIEDELIAAKDAEATQRMAAWEERAQRDPVEWTTLDNPEVFAAFGTKFERLEDGSYIARGDRYPEGNYTVKARTNLKNITGVRLEVLTDHSLSRGGPGRAKDGMFYLTDFTVDAGPADQPDKQERVALSAASADYSHPDFPISHAIDGDHKTKWGIDAGPGRRNQDRQAVFAAQTPINYEGGTNLTIRIFQRNGMSSALNIGRFRISVTTAAAPHTNVLPASVRALLAVPAAERNKEQQRAIFSFYRTLDPKYEAANRRIDELMKDWPYGPTTLALAKRGSLRETHIFKRGDWRKPGDAVTPGVLSALHPFPQDAPQNRLGLARWITDKENPLTSRVIVNRVWQQYFGQGLVLTADDFGARSEQPSHPELLDWLACELRDRGWSMKRIHRFIVTSATYRQSSHVTPKMLEADPYNRLLARAPRLRAEAETVRDIALAASGLLSTKIGGPSVFPPIPDGVLSLGYGAPMKWETSIGEDRYRRAMYTFWKRSVPYPSMLVFDAPNADISCTRRIRSNTPLQALTTLNDQVFMEAAQGLALRVWREGGPDDRARLIYAFRLCLGRTPDAYELDHLTTLLKKQQKYFQGRTAAAVYVSSADMGKLPEDVDLHQLAPWAMVARVLLNLDETITKE
ncbi:MAG: PSD1 and planctomycete cytochrome C domain-containing protein [Pyrinomonadaceae bacterium]